MRIIFEHPEHIKSNFEFLTKRVLEVMEGEPEIGGRIDSSTTGFGIGEDGKQYRVTFKCSAIIEPLKTDRYNDEVTINRSNERSAG